MIEAFTEDTAPRFLLRDRVSIYGNDFRRRVTGMQIEFAVGEWMERMNDSETSVWVVLFRCI